MKWLYLVSFLLIFKFCNNQDNSKSEFMIDSKSRTFLVGDTLRFNFIYNMKYDSIKFFLNNKEIESPHLIKDIKLGDKTLRASVYKNNKEKFFFESIRILSSTEPELFSYEIINEFPHDKEAYTQGLEFYKGKLYESTGLKGKSSLREIDFKNGNILRSIKIDKQFFGEGISILNDSVYHLTWQNKIGFVYSLNDFNLSRKFNYNKSIEGWGLCNDGNNLYKSDGTEKIWTLDINSLKELSFIQVTTNKTILKKINELEWINGKIFANTYQFQKEVVLIINPLSGKVEGVIDFSGLKEKVEKIKTLNVLNGIAYNKERKTIFITGKNWSKVFEIKLKNK